MTACPSPFGTAQLRSNGFTLIEVLVALAMTAVALVAGIRATAALADNAQRQDRLMLAQICADNQLVALRLARQLPGVGETRYRCTQGGQTFEVAQKIQATPNPNFQRAEARVLQDGTQLTTVATILGRN